MNVYVSSAFMLMIIHVCMLTSTCNTVYLNSENLVSCVHRAAVYLHVDRPFRYTISSLSSNMQVNMSQCSLGKNLI